MKLLLDAHVVLWWLDDPNRLSEATRDAIADPAHDVFVSAVVAWEIAIKRRLGKLDAPPDLHSAIQACGFRELVVSIDDALRTESLPLHHTDPFDRLLVAQAIGLDAALVTRDENQQKYSVAILKA